MMTSAHRSDREALDAALDRLVASRPGQATGGIASLVEVARAAREALAVPVPAAAAERHLAALAGGAAAVPISRARSRRARRLSVALAAAVAVTLLSASAVAASQTALPGQLLYPVKRAAERVSLTLHRSPQDRARLHLEFAERRLVELQELIAARRSGQDVDIGAAMRAYHDQIAHVENDAAGAALGRNFAALLAHIDVQLQKHVTQLIELRDAKENERARQAIQDAIDRAETLRQRVGHGRQGEGPGRGKPQDSPGNGPDADASSAATRGLR